MTYIICGLVGLVFSFFGIYLIIEHIHFRKNHKKNEDFVEYELEKYEDTFEEKVKSLANFKDSLKQKIQKNILFLSKIWIYSSLEIKKKLSIWFIKLFGISFTDLRIALADFFFHNYDDYKKRIKRFKKKLQEESSKEHVQ